MNDSSLGSQLSKTPDKYRRDAASSFEKMRLLRLPKSRPFGFAQAKRYVGQTFEARWAKGPDQSFSGVGESHDLGGAPRISKSGPPSSRMRFRMQVCYQEFRSRFYDPAQLSRERSNFRDGNDRQSARMICRRISALALATLNIAADTSTPTIERAPRPINVCSQRPVPQQTSSTCFPARSGSRGRT
jgi:hypothetical protein